MGEDVHYPEGGAFVNSIIGEGTTLRGDFELNGLLRIDGTFFGSVRTTGKVLIGKNGTSECDIVAGTIVVGGKVTGNIVATEKITLLSTGEVFGSITTPRLVVEEGVLFNGSCAVVEDRNRLEELKRRSFQVHQAQDKGGPVGAEEPAPATFARDLPESEKVEQVT
jgi:cytoskeletal protein CcmA (bactofilin family)